MSLDLACQVFPFSSFKQKKFDLNVRLTKPSRNGYFYEIFKIITDSITIFMLKVRIVQFHSVSKIRTISKIASFWRDERKIAELPVYVKKCGLRKKKS